MNKTRFDGRCNCCGDSVKAGEAYLLKIHPRMVRHQTKLRIPLNPNPAGWAYLVRCERCQARKEGRLAPEWIEASPKVGQWVKVFLCQGMYDSWYAHIYAPVAGVNSEGRVLILMPDGRRSTICGYAGRYPMFTQSSDIVDVCKRNGVPIQMHYLDTAYGQRARVENLNGWAE